MRTQLKLSALCIVGVTQWGIVVNAQSFRFPTDGNRNAQESISTQDGTICTQNVNGRASLNMGVYGESAEASNNNISFLSERGDNFGGFVMVHVPLSAPPRLDCAKLLEMEYQRAKLRFKQEQLEVLEPTEAETQNPLYK